MASIINHLLRKEQAASPSKPKKAPQTRWVNSLMSGDSETTLREMTQFTANMPPLKRRGVFMNVRAKWRKLGGDVTSETYRQLCGPDNEDGYKTAIAEKVVNEQMASGLKSQDKIHIFVQATFTLDFIKKKQVEQTLN